MFRTSAHFFLNFHALKTWFELLRVKLYGNDLKGNKNYFWLAGGSEGFELPRVNGKISVNVWRKSRGNPTLVRVSEGSSYRESIVKSPLWIPKKCSEIGTIVKDAALVLPLFLCTEFALSQTLSQPRSQREPGNEVGNSACHRTSTYWLKVIKNTTRMGIRSSKLLAINTKNQLRDDKAVWSLNLESCS